MIFNKQLLTHNPKEGVYGDCFRTCIACLFDLQPGEVPHPYPNGSASSEAQLKVMDNWLAMKGVLQISTCLEVDLEDTFALQEAINPNVYYLLTGTSKNGAHHSVICLNDKIIWDPSKDDSGIVAPCDDGYYWVSWFVPISHHLRASFINQSRK